MLKRNVFEERCEELEERCKELEKCIYEFSEYALILIEIVAKDRGMKIYEVMNYLEKEHKRRFDYE